MCEEEGKKKEKNGPWMKIFSNMFTVIFISNYGRVRGLASDTASNSKTDGPRHGN